MIKVYTASKITRAAQWKALYHEWPEIHFVARWPFCHTGNVPDDPCYAKVFWQQDHEDVVKADVVLLLAEGKEHLKGGLVEAGMALALGKPVIVIGDHPDYSTWQYHPQVHRVLDLPSARILLRCMAL